MCIKNRISPKVHPEGIYCKALMNYDIRFHFQSHILKYTYKSTVKRNLKTALVISSSFLLQLFLSGHLHGNISLVRLIFTYYFLDSTCPINEPAMKPTTPSFYLSLPFYNIYVRITFTSFRSPAPLQQLGDLFQFYVSDAKYRLSLNFSLCFLDI